METTIAPYYYPPDSMVVYRCMFGSTCRGASISLVLLGVAILGSACRSAHGHPAMGVSESFSSEHQTVMVWWILDLVLWVAASLVFSFSIDCQNCVKSLAFDSVAIATITYLTPMFEIWVITPAIPIFLNLGSKYDYFSRVKFAAVSSAIALICLTLKPLVNPQSVWKTL